MNQTVISILLLEDNPGDAQLVREALRASGGERYHVQEAERLGQALEFLRAKMFDMAILDLNLPDSQGLDTFFALREEAPELPMLVLTGVDDAASGRQAMRNGAQEYFVKGDLTGRAVARAVAHALERSRLERSASHAVARLNRALRTFSAATEKLLRAADERSLLADLCEVFVETGGHRVAWVAYARDDAAKSLEVMAAAGAEKARLAEARDSWADEDSGSGPVGEAIRSGNRQLVIGLREDPARAALREHLPADTACLLALPLCAGAGRSFGALAIGTAATEGFDAEELGVLEELAEDLAFAIMALRGRNAPQPVPILRATP